MSQILNTLKEASFKDLKFYIDANNPVKFTFGNKRVEHKFIGDFNLNEKIGLDIFYFEFTAYIYPTVTTNNDAAWYNIESQLQEFQNAFLSNDAGLLILPDYNPVYVAPSQASTVTKYLHYYTIEVKFSNAPVNLSPLPVIDHVTLPDLRAEQTSFLQKTLNFQDNVFSKVQAFQGKVTQFATTIQGISANVNSITTLVSGVFNTASVITNNLLNLAANITVLQETLFNIPNNISSFSEALSNVMDAFKAIYAEPETQVDALMQLSDFGNTDQEPSNTSNTAVDSYNNAIALNVVVKSECLTNMYTTISEIQFITAPQIQQLQTKEQEIFAYVINNSQVTNTFLALRNSFYIAIQNLLANAIQIQEVKISQPMNLHTLVYQYNGNLDLYDETRFYNKISNTFAVQGNIKILLNNE